MKKIGIFILCCILTVATLFTFAGCGENNRDNEPVKEVNVYMPDGTPALAMAQVLTEGVPGDRQVKFHFAAADVIAGKLSKGEADLAVLPTISGATLYKKGAKIQLISTNVFGNLFVVGENAAADSLQGLIGKVVFVTTGTTVQMFKTILQANDIETEESASAVEGKVALRTFAAASDVMPMMIAADKNGTEAYGVFGEPQVTQLKGKIESAQTIVDFQAEWKTMTGFDGYPQASLFGADSFTVAEKEFIKNFTDSLKTNAEWLRKTENIEKFQTALQNTESTLKALTLTGQTIANCNLGYQSAREVKESVLDYVPRLGGVAPDDRFFYAA